MAHKKNSLFCRSNVFLASGIICALISGTFFFTWDGNPLVFYERAFFCVSFGFGSLMFLLEGLRFRKLEVTGKYRTGKY